MQFVNPTKIQAMVAAALALTIAAVYAFSFNSQAHSQTLEPQAVPAEEENTSPVRSTAIFAGGCFWCVEADFDKLKGVLETTSGYTGGDVDSPTYKQVVKENTGHYEAVRIVYDPNIVTYPKLVEYFFRHVDPLDAGGQFCDRGASYRTAIFVNGEAQQKAAQDGKKAAGKVLGKSIVTPIIAAGTFWPAEGLSPGLLLKKPCTL